ncbi:MAG TPA: glycosyltransferase, partial [Terracidiphilus sp.]
MTSSRPTVLVYRNVLLPTSETFIKEQVKATRRWRAVLVGRRPVHQLALDDVDVRLLMPHNGNIFGRISWKIGEWTATSQQSAAGRLKVEGASLIHAHFGMDAIDAWPIAQALGLPMLVTLHGFDIGIHREFWEAGRGGRTLRNYPRNLLRLARNPRVHFIAVSDALRQCAIAFGIPQEKIRVSYTGIDTTRFVPAGAPVAAREPRALFVGRLVEKKGCEYLIKAFAHVQARAPGASLVIIGDGPLRSELQELASKEGVRAEFRGAQSHENVLLELQKVRALCLPSIRAKNGDVEGFGMVLLEAQASGV